MKCPACKEEVVLTMSERNGIEIDFCPNCRGVWLDRGELDKILQRAATEPSGPIPYNSSGSQHSDYRQPSDSRRDGYRHKRKKSFLEDLFD